MKFFSKPESLLALLALSYPSPTEAHSWVEQLMVVASNGSFVGTPGYPRGFIQRTEPDFADANLINLIPPDGLPTGTQILPDMLMCRQSQFIGNYTSGYPALSAAPGDQIALIYEENGHVTKLSASATKPVGSGTVYVYGTTQPSNNDTYLDIVRVWNTAGTGGDGRGKLLATRHFDDGQCFQNSTQPLALERRQQFNPVGNDLNCQTDVQIPDDAGAGNYTLYWVWEWPQLDPTTGAVVTNESYTTCMDVIMNGTKLVSAGDFNDSQIIDSRAIQAQLSTSLLVNPTIAEQLTTTAGVAPQTISAGSVTSPSAPGTISTGTSTPKSSPSSGGGQYITVTVTESAAIIIVTVTDTLEVPIAASTLSPSTPSPKAQTTTASSETIQTSIPIAATSTAPSLSTSQSIVVPFSSASSVPLSTQTALSAQISTSAVAAAVSPFLNAQSSPISIAAEQSSSTQVTSAATTLFTTVEISSTLPTSHPSQAPTTMPSSASTLQPNPSNTATFPNGTAHSGKFRLRGRIFES